MRVLVTGGTGRIGMVVTAWLLERGFAVKVIDRRAADPAPEGAAAAGLAFAACDINDYPALREQVRGCQAIVHLAALPTPAFGSPDEVFRVNAAGSFNVYRAAEEEGIHRVVQASSINAVGLYYGLRPAEPLYFPLDEAHPPQATDAYSFSKWVVEEIADYHWRRAGISGISLRFPGVFRYESGEQMAQRREHSRRIIEQAAAMPEDERLAWLEQGLEVINNLRSQGVIEDPAYQNKIYRDEGGLTAEQRWLFAARSNLWAALDERDAAQAVEKGLTADYTGSHPLFLSDRNNTTGYDSEMLARLFFPRVAARRRPLVGTESLVSSEKARQVIGFEPQYTFAG